MQYERSSTIVLVPGKLHIKKLFQYLNQGERLLVVPLVWFKDHDEIQNAIFVRHVWFGLRLINRFIKYQMHVPVYLHKFKSVLNDLKPDALIVFDFYHWYFLQSVHYVKKYPECKLFLYSETKRWPQNFVSRAVMKLFLDHLNNNLDAIGKVLVYTQDGKTWWNENVPEAKVEIVPAPVDVEQFVASTERKWLPMGTLRILMNARYSAYKNHSDLLAAAANLRTSGRAFHITFIGRADSGRDSVERLVAESRFEDAVTFLDPLPMEEMPKLYHQHDVLVLPSYNEAIGMVVPEAMASGLPTITSDTVGANVYVKDGETGFIFPTGDTDALSEKLSACFDRQRLENMSMACRSQAERFSVKEIGGQIAALL